VINLNTSAIRYNTIQHNIYWHDIMRSKDENALGGLNRATYTHTHTTVLLLFWNMSGTTRVSRYQKGKTKKVKPIWIYWSKR